MILIWVEFKIVLQKFQFWISSLYECWLEYAAIDAPGGFLFEWWSVFWDIFIARTNEKHSETAAAYIEVAF
jgi:hypothetical protein